MALLQYTSAWIHLKKHLREASKTFSDIWENFQNLGIAITVFLMALLKFYSTLALMETQLMCKPVNRSGNIVLQGAA